MWEYLKEIRSEFKFLLMKHINQDIIEHIFGYIRNLSGNAFNPTPVQYYYSFRKSFATNHCSVQTGNCTVDFDIEKSQTDMMTRIAQFEQPCVQNDLHRKFR